jgi:hypothetical protein
MGAECSVGGFTVRTEAHTMIALTGGEKAPLGCRTATANGPGRGGADRWRGADSAA